MKIKGAGFLSFLLVFSLLLTNLPAKAETMEPTIQVKLVNYLGYKTEINIQPAGDYLVDQTNIKLTSGKSYTVKYDNTKISLLDGANKLITSDIVRIVPLTETNSLSVNNRPYVGSFRFTSESSKYVRPVNEVFMEDYLKGVVPFESYESWNKEALKAQAVASRTYALSYQTQIIDDTINKQVYGGYTWKSTPNSVAAVDETRGEVLYSGTSLVSAVFSASNGGKTESNANVWGGTALSYFTIKEDPFDSKTTWKFTVNKQQLIPAKLSWEQMNEADGEIAKNIKTWMASRGITENEIKITGIPVLSLFAETSGGRVSKGDITVEYISKDQIDANGAYIPQKIEYKNVPASQIRAMVGINKMLSYLVINQTETNDAFSVSGLGNGHGVGLSQWGAENRARAGQKYNEILAFYYEGASLVKQYTQRPVTTVQAPAEITPAASETPSVQTLKPASPAPAVTTPVKKDTTAPKISGLKVSVDNTKYNTAISFSTNETAKITIYVKDSKGKVLPYLKKDVLTKAGKVTQNYKTANVANGRYTVVINTMDTSNNRSSATTVFTVKKVVKAKTGKVTASRLYLRATASTKSKALAILKRNQVVTIVSSSGSWYKVKYGKNNGYVSKSYIK